MKGHFVTHGGSGLFRGGVRRIGPPLRVGGVGGGGGMLGGGGGDSSMKCPDVCAGGLKCTHYEGRLW